MSEDQASGLLAAHLRAAGVEPAGRGRDNPFAPDRQPDPGRLRRSRAAAPVPATDNGGGMGVRLGGGMPPQARPGPRPDRLSGGRVMNWSLREFLEKKKVRRRS